MKEKIREMLEDALPLVDFDSDFLFSELDSLGVTTILMKLADEYGIEMEASDATPKNLKSLDSIVSLVERKISEKRP
ncbi:MAG: acyl carrier protein [Prevotella sp.]|nr:acyl carrier protein [Prevotella sp.]